MAALGPRLKQVYYRNALTVKESTQPWILHKYLLAWVKRTSPCTSVACSIWLHLALLTCQRGKQQSSKHIYEVFSSSRIAAKGFGRLQNEVASVQLGCLLTPKRTSAALWSFHSRVPADFGPDLSMQVLSV